MTAAKIKADRSNPLTIHRTRMNWDDGNTDKRVQRFKGSKVQRFFGLKCIWFIEVILLGWTGMIGTRMTRIKEEDSFATQKKTDKGRIGSASHCFGLKCIWLIEMTLFGWTGMMGTRMTRIKENDSFAALKKKKNSHEGTKTRRNYSFGIIRGLTREKENK